MTGTSLSLQLRPRQGDGSNRSRWTRRPRKVGIARGLLAPHSLPWAGHFRRRLVIHLREASEGPSEPRWSSRRSQEPGLGGTSPRPLPPVTPGSEPPVRPASLEQSLGPGWPKRPAASLADLTAFLHSLPRSFCWSAPPPLSDLIQPFLALTFFSTWDTSRAGSQLQCHLLLEAFSDLTLFISLPAWITIWSFPPTY